MTNEITLKVGEMVAVQGSYLIKSIGIGSCVVIVLYDKDKKIGAMTHSMLPAAFDENEKSSGEDKTIDGIRYYDSKYIDTTIPKMLDLVIKMGADKDKLKVKLVGGAAMFKTFINDSISVGSKNVEISKKILSDLGLTITAENTGGNQGRSVSLNTANGVLNVNTRI